MIMLEDRGIRRTERESSVAGLNYWTDYFTIIEINY